MEHNKKTLQCLMMPEDDEGYVTYTIKNPLEIYSPSEDIKKEKDYIGVGVPEYFWGPNDKSLENFDSKVLRDVKCFVGKVEVIVGEEYDDGTTLVEVPINPYINSKEFIVVENYRLLESISKEPKLLISNEQEFPIFTIFLKLMKSSYSKK